MVRDWWVLDIPSRYADLTLHGYEPATPTAKKALAAATRWSAGEMSTLALLGKPGVGKSHLAAAAVRAWWHRVLTEREAVIDRLADDEPRPPRPAMPQWCNVPELLLDLRSEMHLSHDEQRATLRARQYREHAAPLVLDDLGREKASDWTSEVIYALVNARYEARLPTIATSNLTPDELVANGYWPAISRLAEDGMLVRIEAPDHRVERTRREIARLRGEPA